MRGDKVEEPKPRDELDVVEACSSIAAIFAYFITTPRRWWPIEDRLNPSSRKESLSLCRRCSRSSRPWCRPQAAADRSESRGDARRVVNKLRAASSRGRQGAGFGDRRKADARESRADAGEMIARISASSSRT